LALSKKQFAKVVKKRSLLTFHNPKSILAEQFRTIRTNLQFLAKEQKNRTIIISSPGFEEGKTMITANLGISLAEQGKKVLIVDADLRKPGIHTLFKFKNSIGLMNVLIGEISFEEAINHTEIDQLDLLTSGPTPFNPAKLISSEAMKHLLELAVSKYDFVLFDSPPVLEVSDTKIMANVCDGVILVLSQVRTHRDKAIEAKKVLQLARANIVGVAFNERR
jgi:protein-tyrosine kinase